MKVSILAGLILLAAPCLVVAKGKPGGDGGGDGETETTCAAAGQVAFDCDPDAKDKKAQSCCAGLACRGNYCNYALEGTEASQCGGPSYPTHCAPGLSCEGTVCTCVRMTCVDWCRQYDNLGWYINEPLEAWMASDRETGCSSSTGCGCTLSSFRANTFTIAGTGDICDTHNFVDASVCDSTTPDNACDGTQCELMQPAIGGFMSNGDCICTATANGMTKNVWSSSCEENTKYDWEGVGLPCEWLADL